MKSLVEKITTIILIAVISLGCQYLNFNKDGEISNQTKTPITKDVLNERLTKKGVKIFASDSNPKPNPNYLVLKMVRGYAPPMFKLNDTDLDFPGLVMKLNAIFIGREKNGIFPVGTGKVEKQITLSATDSDISLYNNANVTVEDFEKLVDDLGKEKFDQIYLTFNELPTLKLSELEKVLTLPITKPSLPVNNSNSAKNPPNMVSSGIVNGKAINLVKPQYPPAAKAVRASGAVNVQVVIDEQGNVISASAVSGHPLLKSAAESAAKTSKFAPTILSGKAVKVSGIVVYNFSATE